MRSQTMTEAELMALPVSVNVDTAARALGVGRTKAYAMVRDGTWPTTLLPLGNSYRVPTAELRALLGVGVVPAA